MVSHMPKIDPKQRTHHVFVPHTSTKLCPPTAYLLYTSTALKLLRYSSKNWSYSSWYTSLWIMPFTNSCHNLFLVTPGLLHPREATTVNGTLSQCAPAINLTFPGSEASPPRGWRGFNGKSRYM